MARRRRRFGESAGAFAFGAFGRLLCYGAPSTAFRRKRSGASVLSKALLISAMLMIESWATEIRSCPWPHDSASG